MRLSVSKALALSACFVGVPLLAYAQGFLEGKPSPKETKPWMQSLEKAAPLEAVKPAQVAKPAPVQPKIEIKTQASPVSYQQIIPQLPAQTQETDGPLVVYTDRAEVQPLPKNIASLVIGNPLIADASIHPGGFMVITAKGLGTTNLIMLDSKGQTLAYRLIKVKTVSEQTVRVFRGIERETYNCAPHCDRTQTLGDNNPFFDAAIGQSTTRASTLSGVAKQQ